MKNNALYRPCTGIVLYKPNHGIFAGTRIGRFQEYWQMPQGGIDPGEHPLNAAKRELFEETSVISTKLLKDHNNWLYYDVPEKLRPEFWQGKYIGQKQKWFLLEFTGDDSEINLNTKEPEFSNWNWVSKEFLLKNIVPFKKEIYKEVLAGL